MEIYQPDIFPFNIAVMHAKELDSDKNVFTMEDGEKCKMPQGALGTVFRGYRGKIPYSIIVFSSVPSHEIIAHEAFHATCDLLEHIGVDYDRFGNNETFAYTLQYIVRCINLTIEKETWE